MITWSALPSWLINPLWDQFAALLPVRPVFDKFIQVLRFGCLYAEPVNAGQGFPGCRCSARPARHSIAFWHRNSRLQASTAVEGTVLSQWVLSSGGGVDVLPD
jgi:hypothetical protein